eukprot:UN12050
MSSSRYGSIWGSWWLGLVGKSSSPCLSVNADPNCGLNESLISSISFTGTNFKNSSLSTY